MSCLKELFWVLFCTNGLWNVSSSILFVFPEWMIGCWRLTTLTWTIRTGSRWWKLFLMAEDWSTWWYEEGSLWGEGSSLLFTSTLWDTKVYESKLPSLLECFVRADHCFLLFILQFFQVFLSIWQFSFLYLRLWNWSGDRGVCHCHSPGQSSSKRRFSHSWRQTDCCESLSASMETSFLSSFFKYSNISATLQLT